jgi:hypothetical protein
MAPNSFVIRIFADSGIIYYQYGYLGALRNGANPKYVPACSG